MPKTDPVTSAAKSGLILAPSRYRNRLINGHYSPRLSTTVHVYSAAMMQAIITEILKYSVEICTAHKKRTIDKVHIHAAIRETPSLMKLFENIDVFDMGVAQHVSPALINVKKSKSRRKRVKKTSTKKEVTSD